MQKQINAHFQPLHPHCRASMYARTGGTTKTRTNRIAVLIILQSSLIYLCRRAAPFGPPSSPLQPGQENAWLSSIRGAAFAMR